MPKKERAITKEDYQNEVRIMSGRKLVSEEDHAKAMVNIIVRDLIAEANLLTDSHLVELFAVITNEMSNRRGYTIGELLGK